MNARLIAAVAGCIAVFAVYAIESSAKMTTVTPEEIRWSDGPPSLPKGAQFAVISGDPAAEGPFVMRLKLPANYAIAPHWHPADENVTVISGTFHMGEGTVVDRSKAKMMPVGSFTMMSAAMRHFAFTHNTETIIQLHGMGPWRITYVDPKDDPRGGG